jgi:agmatinase
MIFGLDFTLENSKLILVPVPWEVTTSYRGGTSDGPKYILESSVQVEVFDPEYPDLCKEGIHMIPIEKQLQDLNNDLIHFKHNKFIVNSGCKFMCDWVHQKTSQLLKSKKVGLVGGDHSTTYGFIKSLSDIYDDFGILQIDSHADLRESYDGYDWSHASIMFNILRDFSQVSKLVQVGVRDFCKEEYQRFSSDKRIVTFLDTDIKNQLISGDTWSKISKEIINELPQNLYISFDIDGLDPKLCPNTGTPVPGGFDTSQIYFLLNLLKKSGKNIIGFDLNEVSCGTSHETIDSIVGARVLYKLCNLILS